MKKKNIFYIVCFTQKEKEKNRKISLLFLVWKIGWSLFVTKRKKRVFVLSYFQNRKEKIVCRVMENEKKRVLFPKFGLCSLPELRQFDSRRV